MMLAMKKTLLMHGRWMYLPSRLGWSSQRHSASRSREDAGGFGPVVTTRTGIPEATGDQCIYHEAGNVVRLTRPLDEAYNMTDLQRQQLSADARDFAMRFDARRCQQLVNMLGSLKVCGTRRSVGAPAQVS